MNKVHVIVNPFSARGKTEKRWRLIRDIIKYYFKEFKYIFTEKPFQATEIAKELLKEGYDLIIGVGGDGTLNEIVNGYFDKMDSPINNDASLGIIPSGTGSDFIRFLKIPRDFKKSIELIKETNSKRIDVGKITSNNKTKYFINVADFGLGAEVMNNISKIPEIKRGPFSYYYGLLKTIKKYKNKDVKITTDDREIKGKYVIGAIANGKIFGGGMMIAPEAKPDDGFFDLVLIKEMKRTEVLLNSYYLYNGKVLKNKKVVLIRTKSIKIESENNVCIEYDGEIGLNLPAEFKIIHKGLKFKY